ncbi:PDE9A [Symbiodinium pilosum]|uniref:PDE9A protein n=1 Tax=Symbiodinium pilosum TaxID=2952 RepID=A0A812R830_SYMPI|nr:PDE9A [Symbiodinium pilosum]
MAVRPERAVRAGRAVSRFRAWTLLMLLPLLMLCTEANAAWLSVSQQPSALGRRSVAMALTATFAGGTAAAPVRAAVSVEEARQKLQDAQKALDDLLANYEPIKKNKSGDLVRNALKATTSPVAQVQKTGEAVASAASDPGAFQDALEEFVASVDNADGLAYSSGYANSGDWKVNNAANYLEQARAQIKTAVKDISTMLDALA